MPNTITQEASAPDKAEGEILEYLRKRIPVLKATKKNILNGIDFEKIMRDADTEYQPKLTDDNSSGFIIEPNDTSGYRGANITNLSPTNKNQQRINISEPILFSKIQTAIAILIGQNLNVKLKAILEKYKKNINVAKSLWNKNWHLKENKPTLGLHIYDLTKYGWTIGRVFPRLVKNKKKILKRIDKDNPENNEFRNIEIIRFNDIMRERLDPYRTFIDDKTNLSDPFSQDDWYYEKDYSKDAFKLEFKNYSNFDKVSFGGILNDDKNSNNGETSQRDDMVTIGFYESISKDLYAIFAPKDNVVVYYSPLPNDEGKLSCYWTHWNIRDPRTPYGIGFFEILKQNKRMYDLFVNMKMEQLIYAIIPLIFGSGPNKEEEIILTPGVLHQKTPGSTLEQIKIDIEPHGWDVADRMDERQDEYTGITKTLSGKIEGKTLGETLQAKDSALRKLGTPLGNIASMIESNFYLTMSWYNQILSIPEIREFVDEDELRQYEKENEIQAEFFQTEKDGRITADFLPTLNLGLTENKNGILVESPEDRYFQITNKSNEKLIELKKNGQDVSNLLSLQSIKWDGICEVDVRSIVALSQELERQRKIEVFNVVMPVIQVMLQTLKGNQAEMREPDPQGALDLMKPIKQFLEVQDEKLRDWLPDRLVELDENPESLQEMAAEKQKAENPLFIKPNQMNGNMQGKITGTANTNMQPIKPQGQITNPLRRISSDLGKMFRGS